jgi:DNA-binding MarR family transcriptional regulator
MNHSADEPIPAGPLDQDELLGQFEAILYRLAKVMAPSHDTGDNRLSPPQYLVLRLLERSGPMRVSDVASSMGVKNPAASMMLNHMFEHDLVAREPDPDARRATLVSLSHHGAEALHEAEDVRRAFMRSVVPQLEPAEWATVLRGLNLLADAAAEQIDGDGSIPVDAGAEPEATPDD